MIRGHFWRVPWEYFGTILSATIAGCWLSYIEITMASHCSFNIRFVTYIELDMAFSVRSTQFLNSTIRRMRTYTAIQWISHNLVPIWKQECGLWWHNSGQWYKMIYHVLNFQLLKVTKHQPPNRVIIHINGGPASHLSCSLWVNSMAAWPASLFSL